MKVVRVELLEREISARGLCRGKLRIGLSNNTHVVVDCEIPYHGIGGMIRLNADIAHAAIGQLRRLPEFHNHALEIAKHALPSQPSVLC